MWVFLKPLNALLLILVLVWCAMAVVVCPLAKASSNVEQCNPVASDDGRRLELKVQSFYEAGGSQCYQRNGVKLRCGVGNCTCGWRDDLACSVPPAAPKETCQTLRKPLCAPDTSSVETNGYHAQLLVLAIGSSVLVGLVFLECLLNGFAMLQEWFPSTTSKVQDAPLDDVHAEVVYHRFTISFTLPEKNLEFNISGQDDPKQIAVMLLGGLAELAFAQPKTVDPGTRPISGDSASKSLLGPASTAAPDEDDETLMPEDC